MKIERVNENQIRCTLNQADLASRQLKISELAYGSEKQKNFSGYDAKRLPMRLVLRLTIFRL